MTTETTTPDVQRASRNPPACPASTRRRPCDLRPGDGHGPMHHDAGAGEWWQTDREHQGTQVSRHSTPGGEVHLDWRMRPDEWAELAEILLSHGEFPYIAQLIDSGAVPNPFLDDL